MKIAYFDALRGASGNLFLAALLDAGADRIAIERQLRPLLGPLRLKARRVRSGTVRATAVDIAAPRGPDSRAASEVLSLLRRSALRSTVKARALKVYSLLARAEAKVHGTRPSAAHFHELGRAPSIAGVVGTLLALEDLGARRVAASRLPLAEGWSDSAHGKIPLPGPAALELMRGLPLARARAPRETATPTGVALLRALARTLGAPPRLVISAIGYGASQDGRLARVLLGEER